MKTKKQINRRAAIVGLGVLAVFSALYTGLTANSGQEQHMKHEEDRQDCAQQRALTPEQYRILREKGTERPFSGKYNKHYEKGVYMCAACEQPLFSSDAKYDSGSGWPSYYQPAAPGAIEEKPDHGLGMRRVEVVCAKCGGHLGHVFEDGPDPTGLRYCINSGALDFQPRAKTRPED